VHTYALNYNNSYSDIHGYADGGADKHFYINNNKDASLHTYEFTTGYGDKYTGCYGNTYTVGFGELHKHFGAFSHEHIHGDVYSFLYADSDTASDRHSNDNSHDYPV